MFQPIISSILFLIDKFVNKSLANTSILFSNGYKNDKLIIK